MKIAICDDEAIQRKLLTTLITTYMNQQQQPFHLSAFEDADQLFLSYDLAQPYDIVVLDIQMDGMNGMELAKRLRAQNASMAILFVTGVTEYIYDSFDVNAINYLLKPYDEERFFGCLDKAIEQCRKVDDMIILQVDKELIKLKETAVLYVESDGHYLIVVTTDQTYRTKKTMTQFIQELHSDCFYRLDRSHLVNLMAVERITPKQIFLMNHTTIWIPKGKHKAFSQAFMDYHFHRNSI